MLTTASQLPSQSEVTLDITLDNWSSFDQYFKLQCFTRFGVAGQQILTNRTMPLKPFAIIPTKLDLDVDAAGIAVADQFTYARRPFTAVEAALPGFSLASLSLTESSNREFRDDLKIFAAAAQKFAEEDTQCLDYLYKHMSTTSHSSMKTHQQYSTYHCLPIGSRSLVFYNMAKDIHSVGNATTKLHRTRLYMNINQGTSTHEEYMEKSAQMADTFAIDFASSLHPEYVRLSEIHSFLYLAGLNRTQFRRAIDEVLQSTPSGRFPNTSALKAQLQSWKVANSLSFTNDDISTQGSALVAAKASPPSKTHQTPKKESTTRPSHLHPTPCSWCLSVDKVSRYGHLSSNCSKNPNRVSNTSPKSVRSPSTTSTRLHALLGQVDDATSPEDSNAAMLLLADAVMEASDFTDSA